MSKIYGYCMEVSSKGFAEERLKAQKDEIRKLYPDAELIIETVGMEKFTRPIFSKMVDNCKSGDMIVCTRLDRFCRSMGECIRLVDDLLEKDIKVNVLNMGIIDTSEVGQLIYKNLCAFNEFQKAVKVDRMNSKKEVYSSNNHDINVGRPKKYGNDEIEKAVKLLDDHTYSEVAEMTGISKGTLWREKLKRSEA